MKVTETVQEKTLRILRLAESETYHSWDYFYKMVKDYTKIAEEEKAKLAEIREAIKEYERTMKKSE